MKKFVLSIIVIAVFVGYVIYMKMGGQTNNPIIDNKETQTSVATTTDTSGSTTTSGLYKDGSYVGDVTDAYYGNLQVKAIIQMGKITDVQFLDYPQKDNSSRRISTMAMPQLKTEAIQTQSANVNIISGATQTSEAFSQSLASALALAKK